MIKMVIFDLDGTLLNTLDDLADAGNYALSELGFPVHKVEEYKYFVGNGIPKLIERICPSGSSDETQKDVLYIFSSYYKVHMNDKTRPYDGVVEFLEKLKANDIITVVVTNKSHEFAEKIVGRYFGKLIDKTYGSMEEYPKKPDPYWVNRCVSDYEVNKKDIIYIGDSGVDMETAKNAGLFACGVTWGFRTKEELISCGADKICNSCKEIIPDLY